MGNQKKCLIIGGGVLTNADIIKQKVLKLECSLIIACDSGYDNAKKLGLSPEILVGDLDSIQNTNVNDCEIVKLNPEKDDTDLKIAIELAISKDFNEFYIICATGGRLDHFLCNLSILEYIDELGFEGFVIDEYNEISINNQQCKTYKNTSKYVSVIPITETIDITLENLKYPLDNYTVSRQNIISVSNEATCLEYKINVLKGKAYIIKSDNV